MRRLAVFVLLAGCVPSEDEPGRARQAIYGGSPSLNDPAVFLVSLGAGDCTGTLIAPRTILTAAHCIDTLPVQFRNAPSSTGKWFALEARRFSDTDAGSADLGLYYLNEAPPVTPQPWLWDATLVGIGTPVRMVGYGVTENGSFGTRLTVSTTVVGFTSSTALGQGIAIGDATHGGCFGDSGGPAYVRDDAGVERVAGVTSYGMMCPQGVSLFVPPYRKFIEDWLRTHEDAGCPRDDRCVPGCTPTDPDCTCAADGQCTAACVDLVDPDCPASCRTDGVCSPQPCPRLDDDCHPLGAACLRADQCEGRQCVNDPQHASKYCSFLCGGGCPSGFVCDAARGVCIQPQLPTVAFGDACDANVFCATGTCLDGLCRLACSSPADCVPGDACRKGYCVDPDVTLPKLEDTFTAAPAPKGCSTAGGAPVWILLGLWRLATWRRARWMR